VSHRQFPEWDGGVAADAALATAASEPEGCAAPMLTNTIPTIAMTAQIATIGSLTMLEILDVVLS
jgi:hypothetical protein